MTIGKTLAELNVKPGDVVSYDAGFGRTAIIHTVAEWQGERCYSTDQVVGGQTSMNTDCAAWHIVSRAPIIEPTPPRKMHPDDFVNAVNDFARDNGFSVDTMAIKTQGGATVYYTTPPPAN